jgi:glycosyltransferase involved in cell wall biosynthesis
VYIRERFHVPASKISVVYNGVNPAFRPMEEESARAAVATRWGITDPFALFVGRVEPRKNPVRVVEAFARCRERLGAGFRLVVAGDQTWSARDVDAAIDRLGVRPHVSQLGHVELEALIELYNGAEMLVYPSLWEGFGLPIIEAMACGTPVVTANIASMPEVAGGGAVLVDPMDSADIARGMLAVATDYALRDRLRAFGLERAAQFTWDHAAAQTIEAYLEVAGARGASTKG